MPRGFVHEPREASRLELRLVLLQAITSQDELVAVRARGPFVHASLCLDDRLCGEGTHGAFVIEHVDAWVDLAAHGIPHHAHETALAVQPRVPSRRVKRRGAVERAAQTAGDTLGRSNADAHAREGAGATPHQHGIHVIHGVARALQAIQRRAGQLHVGLAAAQVVTRGEHLNLRA